MFCYKCGNELITKYVKNEGEIPYCVMCDELIFPKTNLAMIAILVNEAEEICLINQSNLSIHKVLIAGYVKQGETIEDCVKREIKEEVGIDITDLHYLKSHYYEGNQVLMVGFYAKTKQTDFIIDKDEIDSASWYKINDCLHRIREGSIAYQLVEQYIQLKK